MVGVALRRSQSKASKKSLGIVTSQAIAYIIASPAPLVLFVALVFAVAFACGGQWYVHHRFSEDDFTRHNDIGAVIISISGSLYAVLLGFLTVGSWEHFTGANNFVGLESAAVADAWHMAVGLPADRRRSVRFDLFSYAHLMIAHEWPLMVVGSSDPQGDMLVMNAIGAAGGFKPADLGAANAQSATLTQLGVLHDVRQRRLAADTSALGPFMWFILLFGAICITCFCWLLGAKNRNVHLLMTAGVAVMVTSVLVLLFELQYPFRTGLRIGPDSWYGVIKHIEIMQRGMQPEMRM